MSLLPEPTRRLCPFCASADLREGRYGPVRVIYCGDCGRIVEPEVLRGERYPPGEKAY